jgi:hypothetical protein
MAVGATWQVALSSWFTSPPAGILGLLLDHCAGEGEIANLLGKLLNSENLRAEPQGEAWDCELFPYRAEKPLPAWIGAAELPRRSFLIFN